MTMTPSEVVKALTDSQLRMNVLEGMRWRKKGLLSGRGLRDLAQRLVSDAGIDEADATRMADLLSVEEAAARFSRLDREPPPTPPYELIARLRIQPHDEHGPSRMDMLRERAQAADELERFCEQIERAAIACAHGASESARSILLAALGQR